MIKSFFLQQLLVGSLFDDLSVLHHQDAVRLPDGGQSVCHHKAGVTLHHLGKCLLDFDFSSGVDQHDRLIINNNKKKDKYKKQYAEKFLYLKEGQYALNHFHWYKMEDIINRGGGNILIRVYNSLPDEEIDKEGDVTVHIDGEVQVVPAGTQVKLEPGMSITIMQGMYHDFEVEPGTGPVLIGEVSQCNDDNIDNRFNPPAGRFPEIEEYEPPYRLLCNEYPEAPEK